MLEPDLILTNGWHLDILIGLALRLRFYLIPMQTLFHVRARELTKLTRWYIFNAGPRNNVAFNFGEGLVKEAANDNSNNLNNNGR
ncbi:MAG TPA: hypothetical protein VKA91_09980 [Nitrososphaeraceae archaeon]|nr:hypothetical protein [Nitrososphaeraceae archaeon]